MFAARFLALAFLLSLAAGAARLPDDEVEALREIGKTLGKLDWNFSVNPCGGLSTGWISAPNYTLDSGFANNVTCDCTFKKNTVCHVTNMIVLSEAGDLRKAFTTSGTAESPHQTF